MVGGRSRGIKPKGYGAETTEPDSLARGVLSGRWTEVNRVASNLGNPVAVDVTRQAAYVGPDDLDVARSQQLLTEFIGYIGR